MQRDIGFGSFLVFALVTATVAFAQPFGEKGMKGRGFGNNGSSSGQHCQQGGQLGMPLGRQAGGCLFDLEQLPSVKLTAEIQHYLVYQWEEEKLARDVYLTFAAMHKAAVFQRIAESESQHISHLSKLLLRYGLDFPSSLTEPGVFRDPQLAKRYQESIDHGKASLPEALVAARHIEENDISHLEQVLAHVGAQKTDVRVVFETLVQASERHLLAFQRQGARF